jgi:predicted ABC-type exoprotein transport system permease subunit
LLVSPKTLWSTDNLCEKVDALAPKLGKRGPHKRKPSPDADKRQYSAGGVKRALLFGLATQLIFVSAIFLLFDDLMLPMTQSPIIGIVALGLGIASAYFAWKTTPHPSWLVKIAMWTAGFLAVYLAIPFIEVVVVLLISLISN